MRSEATDLDDDAREDSLQPEESSMSTGFVGRSVYVDLVDFSLDVDGLRIINQRVQQTIR